MVKQYVNELPYHKLVFYFKIEYGNCKEYRKIKKKINYQQQYANWILFSNP